MSNETSLTSLENFSSELNEKQILVNEEQPYFQEKYEGKVCTLCNLGERSHFGQGEMLKLQINDDERKLLISYLPESETLNLNKNYKNDILLQPSIRRLKGQNKLKSGNSENIDEFDKIGYSELLDFYSLLEENKYYYVHRLCTSWSFGVTRDHKGILNNMSSIVFNSLKQKCAFCNHFGASIACKMACSKYFHLPCVAASGGLQIIQNYTTFCIDHIMQAAIICADINITCQVCSDDKMLTNLVICTTCGDLYHGTCIGLPQLPGARAGWQCKSCNKCQICRLSDNSDNRLLSCEQCHKVYHANCLRPTMTSIPKCGWKCRFCRVCSDCGSRTPGSGASSRWHSHYTVCDSCYQQRNKGFSCPICHRAYRAAAHKEMVKCNLCNKFVHSVCDADADLVIYHTKKENNPDYDYICPPCSNLIQNERCTKKNKFIPIEIDNSNSQDINFVEEEIDSEIYEKMSDYTFGKDKMFSSVRVSKRRLGFIYSQPNRNKGKFAYQKRQRFLDCNRKRGPKNKITPTLGSHNHQIVCNNTQNNKNCEEPGVENRLILCSAKDKFLLTQDICVMCGAIGIDNEGCLISCTQCGQCYHPYCVNVKITTVIIQKGWRCLDCTVCEGCGQKNDESRLILCDECDISFHIYCMEPPLDFVPQGHWKCKWCAVCYKCGRNISGSNSLWKTSCSECEICFSKSCCPICSNNYVENEFIIKCLMCEKWFHAACDGIENENEMYKLHLSSYNCVFCRPKNKTLKIIKESESSIQNGENIHKQVNECSIDQIPSSDNSRFLDGVLLSDCGFGLIKSLQMEFKKKRKPKYFSHLNIDTKDAGIMAAIESVVSGGIDDITKKCNIRESSQLNVEPDNNTYDMLWKETDSREICDTEREGQVLKKKRQRNLKKLGIGGFIVRNRILRVDTNMGSKSCNKSSTNLNDISGGKKKRTQKKDSKNKIWETYPSYLQEAFFGKPLLNAQNTTTLESGTSDEEINSNILDDKTILNENQSRLGYNIKKENNNRNLIENLGITPQLVYNQEIDKKLKSLLCIKLQTSNAEVKKA